MARATIASKSTVVSSTLEYLLSAAPETLRLSWAYSWFRSITPSVGRGEISRCGGVHV
jgi:hypothetical protein